MFFDSDTIANRNRLLFGKQGRAGISFLFRIIPILMIAGQLKVDLSFLQLCLLQAENIGICRLKVFLKTFFPCRLSVHLRSRISFFSYAIHLLFLTVCSLRFLLQNAWNRLPFSFIPLSEHTALPATHPTVREIRSRLLYTGASVPTFLCCTARPGR